MENEAAEVGSAKPPDSRQTLSFLRDLFRQRGIHPKNKLGQNFLIDLNLVDLLLRTAELGPQDIVLEVGCGTGSLTARLCDAAGAVVGVEIDADFVTLVRESTADRANFTLLHADILKNKNELNPGLLEALRGKLARSASEGSPTQAAHLKLVSNLPYVVATPVIANLLLTDLPFERIVVTVQWEIAERLAAEPGTSDFGALSVLVQSLAQVHIVRRLAPTVFWPKPQVESAIVLIRPDPSRRALIPEPLRFRSFLRDLYTHRRKNLRGSLTAMVGKSEREMVDCKLAELGLRGDTRAEDLSLEHHRRLYEAFAA
jgi:16S rRNA (adenine1518-N6/adenine1519-N6)-dimethyltransferase